MRVLSLFSGVAGLDLGVRLAIPDARVVAYIEKDDYCQRVLKARMDDGVLEHALIHTDITTFHGAEWRGRVDLICGGFPCQDVSNAGKREGVQEGNRSGLWYEFARIIREVEPEWVFVENVAALVNRGLDTVLGSLAELRFDACWGVFSAADVGAPHLRKRLFLLAHAQVPDRWPREAGDEGSARERWAGSADDGAALADAQSLGGELRPAQGERPGRPAGGDGDVAHADHSTGGPEQEHEHPLQAGEPGSAGRSGVGQADTGRERLEGLVTGGPAPGAARRGGGAEVGDAAGDLRGASWDDGREPPDGPSHLPLFPPGPAELDAWRAILDHWPDLAPATESEVRVHAHGSAGGLGGRRKSTRVPRLRALGNSVVPATSALALCVLYRRLIDAR